MFYERPAPVGMSDDSLIGPTLFPVFALRKGVARACYQVDRVTRICKSTSYLSIVDEDFCFKPCRCSPAE